MMSIAALVYEILFLLSLFISSSFAQSCSSNDTACLQACDIPSLSEYSIWTVNSSEDLDNLTPQGCNWINASISIGANYSGQFVLDGIRVITGQIASNGFTHESLQNVSAIIMPDLLTLECLFVRDTANLLSISMPSLQNVTTLELQISGPTALEFNSLTYASNIIISGPVGDIYFQSLANVNSSLEISSSDTFEDLSAYGYNTSNVFPPLSLRFPFLVNATGIDISGNISEIYMPNLAIAENGHLTNGIVIETYGVPIDVSFPKLDTLQDMVLAGTMKGVSFPSLQNVPGHIAIESVTPVSLNLSSLVNVTGIAIDGNVTGVFLPSLKNITTLSIFSKLPLSCTPTQKIFESIRQSTTGYDCSSSDTSSHLSTGDKVGIGIGSAAAGSMILACLSYFYLRRKRNQNVVKERTNEHELQDRGGRPIYHEDDYPPEYSSRAGTDIGSTHSDETIVEDAGDRRTATASAEEGRTTE
ncbi:uncharacterized protein LY89DRAFT_619125 [Mollisia scopiformis]|uniref:Uncharacterized protein n=1 Tax=Mollisia scopiformis TaxID=149040 RepID=A0A194X523_MOLSC|nr:uncharacterized protein LY89DRAFT_619125 [Mollisia scopiformis]KUJ15278.1 hypothetical protein LY89DRAFT_619125 [Mollisia scopiformis]